MLFAHVVILIILITIMGIAEKVFSTNHIKSEYLFYKVSNFDLLAFKASLSFYLLFN